MKRILGTKILGSMLFLSGTLLMNSCGGDSEPAGDQAAAAELYIKLYSPSNPDCVRSEHGKVDNATATHLLEAYTAYEAFDYAKEDAAYAAIDDEVETKLTAALNKCALG